VGERGRGCGVGRRRGEIEGLGGGGIGEWGRRKMGGREWRAARGKEEGRGGGEGCLVERGG